MFVMRERVIDTVMIEFSINFMIYFNIINEINFTFAAKLDGKSNSNRFRKYIIN